MRSILLLALILSVFGQAAATETADFSFEGFSVGMSRQAATNVRPDIPWKEVMRGTPSEAIRKGFRGNHLGHEAEVSVDLGSARTAVGAIGFTFATRTDEQCISGAVQALASLERLYGVETEVSHEQPGKRAEWVTKGGLVVRWFELCASGAQRYVVTYSSSGG